MEYIKKHNDKNLLVVTPHYLSFVKDQVELVSQNFNHIYVLVRYNPLRDIFKYLPKRFFSVNASSSIIDHQNKPDNISIMKTKILYGTGDHQYIKLGENHFKTVENVIKNNGWYFDLVHAHFTWSSGYAGARLKEKYNIPFVITAHGYDIYDLPFRNNVWREKIEYVLNTADHIITVSNKMVECINRLNIHTPVTMIPNGFNSDLFYPRDPLKCREILGLPQNKKIVLTVGDLVPVKGQSYLVDAMREVSRTRKDVLCVIVGHGPQESNLEQQINQHGLNDVVTLSGAHPHQQIPVWMNACDLFVLPSLQESFGIVQIEAMACGKPVVATRNGGSDEIILSETHGLLCEPADKTDLANKILEALDKEWDNSDIISYTRRFDLKSITAQTTEIYESLLDK
ncbi:MAG: glycosyltransferase [Dehalococcoidales bacterium]|nr:glycosyltransferase [Dehalococcoidales bacterium]